MKLNLKQNYLYIIIFLGLTLRLIYLFFKTGDYTKINLGGDPCHHYNIAYNISNFVGPKTDFIYSFWHRHQDLPAVTDVYLPGFHFFSSIFLFINDSFITTRFITIIIFLLNVLILYLICSELKRKDIGLLSIFLVSFNYFHIENSTVFTTVNFTALIIQLYFYLILLTIKNNNFYYLLGLITGYASITFGGWQILLIISLTNIFIFEKKKYLKNLFKFLILFIFIYLSWGIYTNSYFGSPYYSNLKFYPFIDSWGDMMNSTKKPIISELISKLDYLEYIKNHFIWILEHLTKLSLFNFPTFIFFGSFLFMPLLIYGSFKLKSFGYYLAVFSILYLIGISIASNAMSGQLWSRHFMPVLPINSILISAALISISNIKIIENLIIKKHVINIVIVIAFFITIFGIFYKSTFWERDSKPFYSFGKKVSSIVPENSKIMYGLTVQDLWCVSKRKIVMDPAFRQTKNPDRVKEETEFYNIDYLVIDLSNQIYKRDHESLSDVLDQYKSLNLSLIYKDINNPYYLFKIIK